jgi:hypothetical protein
MFTKQAIAGTVALRDLGGALPEVLGMGAALGLKGKSQVGSLGAMLQVAGQVKGPEAARTSVVALLRELTTKSQKIEKAGVKVWADKAKTTMRDPLAIMKDLMGKTGGALGGKKGLASYFGADAQVIVAALAGGFDKATKDWGKDATVTKVLRSEKEQSVEAMYEKRMEGIGKEAAELAGAMASLDNTIQKYGSQAVSWVASNKTTALVGGAGAAVAWKLLPSLIGGLVTVFSKKPGAGVGGGGLGGLGAIGHGGVQAVFVVNMPGANIGQAASWGFGRTGAPSGPAPSAGPGLMPGFGAGMGFMEKASFVVAAASAGYAVGSFVDGVVKELTGKALSERAAEGLQGSAYDKTLQLQTQVSLIKGEQAQLSNDALARAEMYLLMRDRGIEQLKGAKGEVHATLDEEGIARVIAKQTGMGETPEVLAALQKLVHNTARLRERQTIKFTSDFFGLSEPKTAVSRGPSQGD